MTRALYFELYENGFKATNTFEVYEDNSRDAVKNSYYYDSATYNSFKLNGTNGFSAFTPTSSPPENMLFRIRILYNGSLCFCSAWFDVSDNGYADYIPFYEANGPFNGLYRIYVSAPGTFPSKIVYGTTTLDEDLPIKKTMPCGIYVFWGGTHLYGATIYPPIVGAATVNIGDTYKINLPSSAPNPDSRNNLSYSFRHHIMEEPNGPHSYINDYGLDCSGTTFEIPLMSNMKYDIHFVPRMGVICTGQMAEAISPYAKEFANNGAMCLTLNDATNNDFYSSDNVSAYRLVRFKSMAKRYSVIINTVFMTNGSISGVYYEFSGDSTSFETKPVSLPNGKQGTVATWLAYIYNLLGTNYTSTDLNKSVTVSIGGHITTEARWYYAVIAGDDTIIQPSTPLNSNLNFTTTMRKLDGASVFFSRSKLTTIPKLSKKEKASDYNTIITKNVTDRVLGTSIIK